MNKDDVVNKAIMFTRPFRPINIDRNGNLIDPPTIWDNLGIYDKKMLKELCWAIQNYIYGDENESDES